MRKKMVRERGKSDVKDGIRAKREKYNEKIEGV